MSDPRGHSFGKRAERPEPPDPQRWQACQPYLYGLDLFNHGYYWEAHEVWEGLWHACGRSGPMADFLKGLIHLAAAGVKVREGKPQGVRSHARRAAELFGRLERETASSASHYLGLRLTELLRWAEQLAGQPAPSTGDAGKAAEIVFVFVLWPDGGTHGSLG